MIYIGCMAYEYNGSVRVDVLSAPDWTNIDDMISRLDNERGFRPNFLASLALPLEWIAGESFGDWLDRYDALEKRVVAICRADAVKTLNRNGCARYVGVS